jgi:hypothetical protein
MLRQVFTKVQSQFFKYISKNRGKKQPPFTIHYFFIIYFFIIFYLYFMIHAIGCNTKELNL